jgi:hypothetical protein
MVRIDKNKVQQLEKDKKKETVCNCQIKDQQLIEFLSRELSCQNKKREEKIADIFTFCLEYLNQFEKED